MSGDSPRVRLGVLGIVALSLFSALFARLYYLQVLSAPQFVERAADNSTQLVPITPIRGRILDKAGRILADNRLSTVVSVDRKVIAGEAARTDLFVRIAPLLGVTPESLEDRFDDGAYDQVLPLPLAEDVPVEVAIRVEEKADDFPGVQVVDEPVRVYPFGTLAAHVVGYVGRLPAAEAEARVAQGYQLDDKIGLTGIERVFEADLRGTPGVAALEVDARGRVLREVRRTPPVQGHDVQLTIDLGVQQLAEQTLEQGLAKARERRPREGGENYAAPAGSVVAVDPRDGAVLAMASYPSYDPQQFADGITQVQYDELTADDSRNPLINRAIAGEYAPGSTFKLVTAMAAMETGLMAPYAPIVDTGVYDIPGCKGGEGGGCRRRNAGSTAMGSVDLPLALAASSDVYFYGVGADLWRFRDDRGWGLPLQDAATSIGFGQVAGVALPGERAGRVPTPATKAALHDEAPTVFTEGRWFTGDNVNTAIGQGDVLATPLQLANAYATFANGGTLHQPNVVWRVLEAGSTEAGSPAVVRTIEARTQAQLDLRAEVRQPILEGLVGATTGARGTASVAFAGSTATIAGKTGTAQRGEKRANEETSLFVGFGPSEAPAYAVSVVMEESGFGSSAAAPVARIMFDALSGAVPLPRVVPSSERTALDVDLDTSSTVAD